MKKKLDTYTVTIELPYTHTLAVVNTTSLKVTDVPMDLIANNAYIKVYPSEDYVLFEGDFVHIAKNYINPTPQ